MKIETNIDDMSSEQLGFLMERLLKEKALDVFFTNIYMKKNRPGIQLTVLCETEKKDFFSQMLLKESSTLGIRYTIFNRDILERKIVILNTRYGRMHFKLGYADGKLTKYTPEYEDCRIIALNYNLSIQQVYSDVTYDAENVINQEEFSKF